MAFGMMQRAATILGGGLWRTAWLLLSLTALFWAGNAVVGRAVTADFPPVALAFWRWVLASALVAPFAWRRLKEDLPALVRAWPLVLLLSLLGIAAFNTLLYTALHSTTVINAVLLQSVMPPLILLASFIIFRERAGAGQLIGLLVALVGVAAIVSEGAPGRLLHLHLNPGDLMMLAAVIGYAVYSALLRKRPPVHPSSFLLASFMVGAAMLAPLYLLELLSGRSANLGGNSLAALLYVAVFPSILAYLFFNRGVELMGANRAGLFIHLIPVFGAVLAMVFLGEALRPYHAVGAALIGLGIVLSTRRPSAKAG
jgi:drug/metabolite transporter (DMT)-like permease